MKTSQPARNTTANAVLEKEITNKSIQRGYENHKMPDRLTKISLPVYILQQVKCISTPSPNHPPPSKQKTQPRRNQFFGGKDSAG